MRLETDVRPAIEALAANYAVDTTRTCAVGIGDGAYVSLLHAAEDPALLRCVVGIETIVNPDSPEARSLLFEGPPMTASVLLVESSVLPFEGVPRLRKELASAGVQVELTQYPGWEYELPALREAFYNRLSAFLAFNLR